MSPGPDKVKLPARICNKCGDSYEQRDNEHPSRFAKRKYCSTKCRQQSQRIDPKLARTCEACGKSFKRRDGEEASRFNKRRSCDNTCAHSLRKGKRYGDPTYSGSRKQRPTPRVKSNAAPIRIVEREPQAEPVRWVPAPTPKLSYVPSATVTQAENLTQSERVARRTRFGRAFQPAS